MAHYDGFVESAEEVSRLTRKIEPERDFYVEAQMIMKGLTGLLVEKAHLDAMQEFHECSLIRIANRLDETKKTILEMP